MLGWNLTKSKTVAILALWVGAWLLFSAVTSLGQDGERASLIEHRERPDDLPGHPAMPVPGARRAAPVTLGPFTSIQVNIDGLGANIPGDAANEPSIAVDPTNPNVMAIGWRQFDTVSSNFRQAGWAYSTDGGRTWTFPGVLDPGVFRSDPVLGFDAAGNFYYNSLQVVGSSTFNCDVFTSLTGGASWGPAVFAYGGDKAWMTVDRSGGVGDGHLYCAWSTASNSYAPNTFTRSTDGAQTFSYPSLIPLTPIWGTLDVGPDGTLYVAGVDPGDWFQFLVAKSTTVKDSTAAPTFAFTAPVNLNGAIDFGAGPNPGGLLGQAWVGVDHSAGPTAGYVYLACSVDPIGPDPLDVYFARSTDGGLGWSTPLRINDDSTINGAWQWFGTMDVAPNGRIDVIWNDTRNGIFTESELYYAYSMDGGVTWSLNEKLSPAWDSHVGWPNQNKIGDYYDMVSDRVGAHVAWAATFNGEQDVYYLRIGDYDCNANGVGDSLDIANATSFDNNLNGIPDECEETGTAVFAERTPSSYRLHQNFPNPFNPTTTIHFDIPRGGGHVRLQIFDVTGRHVRTLVDGFHPMGGRSVDWDGRDARGRRVTAGLYFYRLEAPDFTDTRKLILLK
jgi:hypothetical protein